MSVLDEARNTEGGAASLLAGLRVLSLDETITFVKYIKQVLPLDGYVFWLKTDALPIKGSLHVSVDRRQLEDETISVNRVIFTTDTEVIPFNVIDPETIWVGRYRDQKFAFSQQGPFYRAANLYHYMGDAVYPAMESQLIDVGEQLSDCTLIVSNSLPAWLALQSYRPIWLQLPNPCVTLYPSFAVPPNLRPPYGVVHIAPAETRALQAIPLIDATGSHSQLAADKVRVTLYGLTNDDSLTWLDLVNQYSLDTDAFGIMAPEIVRDEKRTQAELQILAMKKTLEFEVSYNQRRISDIAAQMVQQVTATFLPQSYGVQ